MNIILGTIEPHYIVPVLLVFTCRFTFFRIAYLVFMSVCFYVVSSTGPSAFTRQTALNLLPTDRRKTGFKHKNIETACLLPNLFCTLEIALRAVCLIRSFAIISNRFKYTAHKLKKTKPCGYALCGNRLSLWLNWVDNVTVGVTSGDCHFRFGYVYSHTYKEMCSTWTRVIKYCIHKAYCHHNGIFF